MSSKTTQVSSSPSESNSKGKLIRISTESAETQQETSEEDQPRRRKGVSQRAAKKVKEVVEYSDISSDEEDEEEEEEPDELFKPTKHVYYLAKNTIKEKRVLPKRSTLKEENEKQIVENVDMKVVVGMLDDIKGILGIEVVNQEAVYGILIKSDNDPNKVLTKIRRNLCYYRRVLSGN